LQTRNGGEKEETFFRPNREITRSNLNRKGYRTGNHRPTSTKREMGQAYIGPSGRENRCPWKKNSKKLRENRGGFLIKFSRKKENRLCKIKRGPFQQLTMKRRQIFHRRVGGKKEKTAFLRGEDFGGQRHLLTFEK